MLAGEMARMHIVSMEDGLRLQTISRGVAQSHTITDDDLDWMLMLLKSASQTDGQTVGRTAKPIELKMLDLGTLQLVKETTPQQQDKVFSALLPLLYGNDTINKGEADLTLAAFKVTKAIPYIQPQLKDPNRGVRRDAASAMKAFAR